MAQSAEDRRWYRALSQGKNDDDTYNLMYLDYGNMENVPVDRIREMREDLFFPSITLLCFIDGNINKNIQNLIAVAIISLSFLIRSKSERDAQRSGEPIETARFTIHRDFI